MPQESIYVDIDPELLDLLSDNKVQLESAIRAELAKEGVQATVQWDRNPTSKGADRDLMLLILVGTAAAGMVGAAVARIIDAVNRGRPTVVIKKQLVPALDGHGNAIRDRNNNPVFKTVEEPVVVGASQQSSSAELSVAKLFQFRMSGGNAVEKGKGQAK